MPQRITILTKLLGAFAAVLVALARRRVARRDRHRPDRRRHPRPDGRVRGGRGHARPRPRPPAASSSPPRPSTRPTPPAAPRLRAVLPRQRDALAKEFGALDDEVAAAGNDADASRRGREGQGHHRLVGRRSSRASTRPSPRPRPRDRARIRQAFLAFDARPGRHRQDAPRGGRRRARRGRRPRRRRASQADHHRHPRGAARRRPRRVHRARHEALDRHDPRPPAHACRATCITGLRNGLDALRPRRPDPDRTEPTTPAIETISGDELGDVARSVNAIREQIIASLDVLQRVAHASSRSSSAACPSRPSR